MAEISFIDREKRERAAKEMEFVTELLVVAIDRLRQMRVDYAADNYLAYDLDDAVASLRRERLELAEIEEGLRKDRYTYGEEEAA